MMAALHVPTRLYIDVTDACRLRCRHCCSSSGCASDDEMSDGEIFRVMDEAHRMGITGLILSGGEPLLRPGTPAFLEHAAGLGFHITLLTNGLLIDEAMGRFLARLGIRVKISLDGATAGTHEGLRGPGTFSRTLEVLRMLAALPSPGLTVHYTVNRRNIRELPDLPDLLSDIGVPNMVIGTIKPSGRAAVNRDLLITPAMIPYVNRLVTRVVESGDIPVVRFTDRGWGEFGCPAVCSKIGITARGYLTTCAFFGEDRLGGNIRESGLDDLWNRHRSGDNGFEINRQCASCSHLGTCAGGCRARAAWYSGDTNAPDPYACSLHQKADFIREHSGLILELAR